MNSAPKEKTLIESLDFHDLFKKIKLFDLFFSEQQINHKKFYVGQ